MTIEAQGAEQIPEAKLVRLPPRVGDGFNWGGGLLVTVGDRAIHIADIDPTKGYLADDLQFAARMVEAWNAYRGKVT